jgi:CRISPR-associated protein Csx10
MITGILTIKMCSDWHIGSGAGRPSSIDRLVQRDQYNLPFIPAKSLTGIWRDSCELLAQGLDNGKPNGAWQQWVTWLFGEQQPEEDENRATDVTPAIAQLSVRSAHFPKTLQSALQNNVLLQSMTTFVKPGVSINPYTGSALAEHLRFEEMSRTGAILQAEYQLDCAALSPEQQKIAEAILVAGASMVERLGAKRRRGAGRCCITVDGLLDLKQAIAKIERATDLTTLPPIAQVTHQAETLTLAEQTDANWWCIELEVTTQSPIIVHRRTVGNHQETQDYIPGTYFLPIVRKQLEQDLDLSIGNALMHGDVVITNANPVIAGIQRRGEAVPFSIFAPKAKTVTPLIHQRIGEAIAPEFSGDQQLRGIRQGYVALQDQMLHRVVVDTEIAVHNTIVDAKQRPDTEVGGIYTYAAIPARQTFRLEVRIRESLVPQNVELLSNFLKKT